MRSIQATGYGPHHGCIIPQAVNTV